MQAAAGDMHVSGKHVGCALRTYNDAVNLREAELSVSLGYVSQLLACLSSIPCKFHFFPSIHHRTLSTTIMALTAASITTRLASSAASALTLSNKFYKVVQALPSAVYEYHDFACQILSISTQLELISQVVPTLELADESKVFGDLTKLMDFLDDALRDSKEGLPQSGFDGIEIDLLLPYEVESLINQLEALGAASNMIRSVLSLAASEVSAEYAPSSTHCI